MHALHATSMPGTTEHLPTLLSGIGRFTALLLGCALIVGAVVGLRFALYEYGHGNGPLVRQLVGALVSGPGQTSR
jgi:hypothetical protein